MLSNFYISQFQSEKRREGGEGRGGRARANEKQASKLAREKKRKSKKNEILSDPLTDIFSFSCDIIGTDRIKILFFFCWQ